MNGDVTRDHDAVALAVTHDRGDVTHTNTVGLLSRRCLRGKLLQSQPVGRQCDDQVAWNHNRLTTSERDRARGKAVVSIDKSNFFDGAGGEITALSSRTSSAVGGSNRYRRSWSR